MSTTGPSTSAEADAIDCRATAALLRAVGTLVWAAHAGAIAAVVSHLWLPLIPWAAALYFAVRARLDADLFTLLAEDPARQSAALDDWLHRAGLRKRAATARSIADRCLGGRRLARNLVYAFVLELLALAVLAWRGAA